MAICKRCGAVFDYNKWDGVCPKCCLYNRPDDGREEDDCWMENYNVDDNSFRFPIEHTEANHSVSYNKNSAYNQATKPTVKVNKPRAGQPVTRVNQPRAGQPVTRVNQPRAGQEVVRVNQPRVENTDKPQTKVSKIIMVVVMIYIIFMVVIPMLVSFFG